MQQIEAEPKACQSKYLLKPHPTMQCAHTAASGDKLLIPCPQNHSQPGERQRTRAFTKMPWRGQPTIFCNRVQVRGSAFSPRPVITFLLVIGSVALVKNYPSRDIKSPHGRWAGSPLAKP